MANLQLVKKRGRIKAKLTAFDNFSHINTEQEDKNEPLWIEKADF